MLSYCILLILGNLVDKAKSGGGLREGGREEVRQSDREGERDPFFIYLVYKPCM